MSDHIQSPPPEEQSEPLLEQTEIPAPSPKKKTSFFKEAIEYLEIFVFAVAAVVFLAVWLIKKAIKKNKGE